MNLLYLECSMGAAGDMMMGALYELLPPEDQKIFLRQMNQLGFEGITLTASSSQKCGIYGTHMEVSIDGAVEGEQLHTHHHDTDHHSHKQHAHHHDIDHHSHEQHAHHHSSYQDMLHHISHLPLSEEVKNHARAVYRLIGEAEAKAHQTTLEQIHFHEVGTMDALIDVTGVCLLMEMLRPDQVFASPVHVGSGTVHCAHGILPVPAPATAELLTGIPIYGGAIDGELCTPTGAALLKHFVTSFVPMMPMTIVKTGYGMGSKDFVQANCLRAFLGSDPASSNADHKAAAGNDSNAPSDSSPDEELILALSCNLDDMTGEALGFATEELMRSGALDVYLTPILMKKGRPGQLLTCLCEPAQEAFMTELIFLHTTTRGVRVQEYRRHKLAASYHTKATPYGSVTMKQNDGYGICRQKAEYEDLARIARSRNCSLLDLAQEISD